jgi:hypothetical protein
MLGLFLHQTKLSDNLSQSQVVVLGTETRPTRHAGPEHNGNPVASAPALSIDLTAGC